MRVPALCSAVILCVACGSTGTPDLPAATQATPAHAAAADPSNIGRARSDLPPGYEVGDLAGRTAPVALWGLHMGLLLFFLSTATGAINRGQVCCRTAEVAGSVESLLIMRGSEIIEFRNGTRAKRHGCNALSPECL